ncbi:unnamed protein product [Candidula unifasciata]|uniref:G-protein coupled receptors family 1 profile domain-containing protein n=1 Tax=Candidula unifasciata TaxID=100452 RepID=A0A8S3ZQJ2_9EUPU|nr:unnamed protein product [Candidula unifasciata]
MQNTTLHGVISASQYVIIMTFFAVAWTLVSFMGIISNVINIKTFVAMGLNDGVTVSFLALSVFDLTYVASSFCQGISIALSTIELKTQTWFPVEPYGLMILFANISILINITNVLTTTFLAVARCMCVAKPLHFKNAFTVKRTVYFMSGFAAFAVTVYIPVLANMGFVVTFNNRTRVSRPTLWMSPFRESIKDIALLLIDAILPLATEVIVLICVVVMTSSLRAAAKFRESSTDKVSGKDVRVVMQVTLISLVYIICNTPKILISSSGLAMLEFRLGKRYNNVYVSLNSFRQLLEIVNATINTFIYCKYNTKFRNSLCGTKKQMIIY